MENGVEKLLEELPLLQIQPCWLNIWKILNILWNWNNPLMYSSVSVRMMEEWFLKERNIFLMKESIITWFYWPLKLMIRIHVSNNMIREEWFLLSKWCCIETYNLVLNWKKGNMPLFHQPDVREKKGNFIWVYIMDVRQIKLIFIIQSLRKKGKLFRKKVKRVWSMMIRWGMHLKDFWIVNWNINLLFKMIIEIFNKKILLTIVIKIEPIFSIEIFHCKFFITVIWDYEVSTCRWVPF